MKDQQKDVRLVKSAGSMPRYAIYCILIGLTGVIITFIALSHELGKPLVKRKGIELKSNLIPASRPVPANAWKAPAENTIPAGKAGDAIRYGRELLAHTAKYFGPKGTIAVISNGMNCQNCHLDAGKKIFGNNYASFISSYPKRSNRSGRITLPAERITECFERSLAAIKTPDTSGKEIKAMLAYMSWLGQNVKKGQNLFGNATEKLAFMNHAADPVKGKSVFLAKCQKCHGVSGEGLLAADKVTYIYPPLWGKHSYNDGAGMYRLINFAGFVKNNMPYGSTYQNPQLTDEEAWNVSAFVNSQPRPHKDQRMDWNDLKKKPIDFPFGPYLDTFSEKQHKYGPYKPIKEAQKALIDKKS
ncbi:c-type cytochrome [Mucilaginibacter terrigena]|uniref:C-type cytochrome n=1 Tax=Mucilaginibacter terrigena TaxID=2492395 RepID=A0A4Q5LRI4_9SPHI|nr:c-type cytochrome [Mucilaginibacter terrigena]RYU91983.1 c-type cytochrome [Mucilaginibacter terrigena]